MNLNSILEFLGLKRFFAAHMRGSDERCHPPLARPLRDWHVIALGSLVVCAIGAAMGLFFYFFYTGTASSGTQIGVGSSGPSAAELSKMLSQYAARGSEYQALLSSAPKIADPAKAL